MTLVADEGVDRVIVERLREAGNSVFYVAEMSPGIADEVVLRLANDRQALLLTADKDFGELVFRLERLHAGVILLRLFGLSAQDKASVVARVVRSHGADMVNAFTVVSPGSVRIRKRLSPG